MLRYAAFANPGHTSVWNRQCLNASHEVPLGLLPTAACYAGVRRTMGWQNYGVGSRLVGSPQFMRHSSFQTPATGTGNWPSSSAFTGTGLSNDRSSR